MNKKDNIDNVRPNQLPQAQKENNTTKLVKTKRNEVLTYYTQ